MDLGIGSQESPRSLKPPRILPRTNQLKCGASVHQRQIHYVAIYFERRTRAQSRAQMCKTQEASERYGEPEKLKAKKKLSPQELQMLFRKCLQFRSQAWRKKRPRESAEGKRLSHD